MVLQQKTGRQVPFEITVRHEFGEASPSA